MPVQDHHRIPQLFGSGAFYDYERKERPFHETLPRILARVRTAGEAKLLGDLILISKVPKGHKDILVAWRAACDRTGFVSDGQVEDKLNQLILDSETDLAE